MTYIEAVDETEPGHEFIYVSPQIEAQLGYAPEEWMQQEGEVWAALLHPEDRQPVQSDELSRVLERWLSTEPEGSPSEHP